MEKKLMGKNEERGKKCVFLSYVMYAYIFHICALNILNFDFLKRI